MRQFSFVFAPWTESKLNAIKWSKREFKQKFANHVFLSSSFWVAFSFTTTNIAKIHFQLNVQRIADKPKPTTWWLKQKKKQLLHHVELEL